MVIVKALLICSIIANLLANANGIDKYSDEKRPYEFGFTIDGEQHRHEKKDENGIIMGEFGFITADGVYHVTVYATDENGRFKILSMKNIRVKPYPGTATQNSRTGHSLSVTNAQQTTSSPVETNKTPYKDTPQLRTSLTAPIQNYNEPNIEQTKDENPKPLIQKPLAAPVQSCSHCSLPTTTTIAPKITTDIQTSFSPQVNNEDKINNNAIQTQYNQFSNQNSEVNQPHFGREPHIELFNSRQGDFPPTSAVTNQDFNTGIDSPQEVLSPPKAGQHNEDKSQNIGSNNYDNTDPQILNPLRSGFITPEINIPNSEIDLPLNTYQSPQTPEYSQSVPDTPTQTSERNPKSYEPSIGEPQSIVGGINLNEYATSNSELPISPKLLSAQMQIVDKNTDIYHKNPGEVNGLPEGVTKDYMMQVLYVFNYTVGFHGHYEKGFADGSKEGYYYVTGRNGVRTRVDYVADAQGFRPKITEDVLDLLSDAVPKPETEKEPQYGLKSYEFKWLYFPVGAKQR